MPNASPHPTWEADALPLYLRLLPAALLQHFEARAGMRQNNRVYTCLVVMWLMVLQRLRPMASLETAVLELLRGLPDTFWSRPCKRLQDWRSGRKTLSSHTGAYNKARQALPPIVVEQSCDRIFEHLTAHLEGILPGLGRRAFFVDGTSVRLAHNAELCACYPPGSNQHGEAHGPLLRMLCAHDLPTGLAMRPEWGPMHGLQAVSQQQLLERALDRLPDGALLIGDANFGVFSVAYAATERRHPVVLRLTLVRAQCLAKGPFQDGIDRPVLWRPSRDDRKSHPGLAAEACVPGRLLVRLVQPSNGSAPFLLYLFVTLPAEPDSIFDLYGQRWNIETDLRSLKSALQLDQLNCATPEMVAKEIDLGMASYNLVRAVTCLAAQRSGIPVRGYSFTRVRNIITIFGPWVTSATDTEEADRRFAQMMHYLEQAKLPKRRRKRPSYPRAVWNKGASFPHRKE